MSVNPVTLAITVALDAAQMAMTAMRKIEGPRVTDLSASVADYGTPLNYLYGVRRLECPCFYCEPIKETKTQTKGKSGKYTEYKYFGTFAMLFADQAITRYSRIWFDRHLVYDITGSGEEVVQPDDDHTLSYYMRQYLGTPDQEPDPRMVATITENEGADRTPAYLDVAYIMFDGLPMEMLGNRFPQVSIEGNSTALPVTLGDICADVARRTGMATGDYDFTALDQLINGFSWTIGQGKQIVAPLVDLYDSDICLHDFQLIGRKRGGDFDDSGIIADDFLLRRADHASSSDQPLYQIILASESDLPRRAFLTYADLTGDQQPNTAVAQRNAISTATTREVPLDMTSLALSPDEAQPLVERWLRRQHIGANTFTYIASPGEIAVECADLRISSLGGELLRGRATRVTVQADRGIGVEWEVDGSVTADDV